MNLLKLLAVVLIVAGVLGLLHGGFTYTRKTHDAKLGPLEVSVQDKETLHIPTWASVGAIAVGTVLLLARGKR